MKTPTGSHQTVQAKWKMLTSSSELVFVLYNGMPRGGVESPMSALSERSRSQASPESLTRLTRAGLIEEENGKWELSQTVYDFLESLAGTSGEANVKTIIGNRETLERNVAYYRSAKEGESDPERYLTAIRKSLKTILNNIRRTLNAIEFSVRDSYMSERSIALKVKILTENLDKLEELESAVRGNPGKEFYDGIVPYVETTFTTADERLHTLGVWFMTELNRFYSARKSRVNRLLRDYLDRIENIDKPARKIEQIFRLWSNNQLDVYSNYKECMAADRPRAVMPRNLHLSLRQDLQPDNNKNLEIIVRKFDVAGLGTPSVAQGITREEISSRKAPEPPYQVMTEVKRIFRDYTRSGGKRLLIDYVLDYDRFSKDLSFGEKIGIFLETANQFRSRLVSDGGYTVVRHETKAYECKNIKLKSA